ncbi:MAG TPA: hypothetical protein VK019_07460 [Pseudomonas sp.]|jgi:hypothetical protein|nr:hypothetical protein [Pseudomonas sp.]
MKIAIAAALLVALAGCGHVLHHDGRHHKEGNYVLVCHKGKKTLELPSEAVDAHLAHGDWVGRC